MQTPTPDQQDALNAAARAAITMPRIRYTRPAMADLARKLITGERDLDDDARALLYAFFMPKASTAKAQKNDFAWMAQAVCDDETRIAITTALVQGKNIVAVDGRRLHVIPNTDGLPDGRYDAKGNRVGDENDDRFGRFPNWQQVVPKTEGWQSATLDIADATPREVDRSTLALDWKIPGGTVSLQKKYFEQAAGSDPLEITFDPEAFNNGYYAAGVYFTRGDRWGVIMPMRCA